MTRRGSSSVWIRCNPAIVAVTCAALVALAALPAGSTERTEWRMVTPETGSVRFTSWLEDGDRFTSVSTDRGRSWSEPRAMMDRISLTAGMIVPGEIAPPVPKNLAAGDASRVFIVQFETQSLAEWQTQLTALGAEVLTWVPYDAHLVRMDPELVSRVEALPFVRWVGPYEPSYRTFPDILAGLDRSHVLTKRYRLMTYTPGASEKAQLASDVAAVGGQVVIATPNGYIVEAVLSDAQVLALLGSNHLRWIDEWSPPADDMDNGRVVSGANYVASTPGGYDGTGVRAEVCDGGVDSDHPDFINPVPIHGAVNSAGDSHGTSTYGINFGNGSGNAAATGMAPNAYGYFAYYNSLFDRYAHTAELVDPALEYQCVYQSNSWGDVTTVTVYNSTSAEMDDIIWLDDISIFQSQSNTGTQFSRAQAWAKNIVSVGGAKHYNNTNPGDDRWDGGASVGPAADGRIKPDLTFFYDWILTTTVGGYRSDFGGTSGATPMVAGTSGLFFQMWADNVWGTAPGAGTVFDERPHFSTMKALLVNTANQFDWTAGGANGDLTRVRQGWGQPNAQNAYDRAPLTHVIDESSVLQALESDIYTATVPASQDALRVTMVYADRAGTPGVTPHRVNDVTLKVTSPSATEYWGNVGLDSGVWSTSGGAADTLNTVENVFIQSPEAGDWTIEVIASEVNMDVHAETPEIDQDYALVVYGATDLLSDAPLFADDFEDATTNAWSIVVP